MIEINNTKEFEDLIANSEKKLLVIKFSAPWCGPCKLMNPIYKNAEVVFNNDHSDISNNVVFCEIDRDQNIDLIEKYELGRFTIPRIFAIQTDSKREISLIKDLGGSQSVDRLIDSIIKIHQTGETN